MSRWFRHYAGMMRDEKLVRVALQSKQPVERVLWVWGAILESAAEINDNGRFDLDRAEVAYFLRADDTDIQRIMEALEGLERISENRVANWGDRQFQSDTSTERTKRYRERKSETRGDDNNHERNAIVTSPERHRDAPETETETETETEKKEATGSAKRRTRYDEVFEKQFWEPYPRTPVMSKKEAFREWQKLSSEDQSRAIPAIPAFIAFLKSKPDHPAVHACRFLSQRRFEGFEAQPPPITAKSVIPGTPEFEKLLAAAKPGSFQHSQMTRSLDTRQPYYPPPELLASLETSQRN